MPEEKDQTEEQASQEDEASEETSPGETESEEKKFPLKEIQKLRREAGNYRTQLRKIEDEQAKAKLEEENKGKTILEKYAAQEAALKRELEEIKKKSAMTEKRATAIGIAAKLNFINSNLVVKALDLDSLESEEEIEEALVELAKKESYLIKQKETPPKTKETFGGGPTDTVIDGAPRPKFTSDETIANLNKQATDAMKAGRVSQAVNLFNQVTDLRAKVKLPGG
jgi:hypothetical protein